jgi:fructokinase
VGAVRHILPFVDVLKVSTGELDILTGTDDLDEGTALLAEMAVTEEGDRPMLVAVTHGAEGAGYVLYSRRAGAQVAHSGTVSGVRVEAIDPTGAGDAFLAGLLVRLLEVEKAHIARLDLTEVPADEMHQILRFANATGALTTTQRGAMSGLPSRRAVQRVLEGRRWA